MNDIAKILVATDFSNVSDEAVAYASAQARMTGARLLIVHVRPTPTADQGEGMLHYGIEREDMPATERRLQEVQEAVEGVASETRLLKGHPAEEILRLARDEDVALIVMGTHGRTGIVRAFMGSVAEQVIRRASCPVMTIKVPQVQVENKENKKNKRTLK